MSQRVSGMRVVHDEPSLREALAERPTGGRGRTFVPTMGALHEGHVALITHAAGLGGPAVVSIFVNPTQFAPQEDFAAYPRSLEADLQAARRAGADLVFAPAVSVIYPPHTEVAVPPLPAPATQPGLEDKHRPGHFAGVCQVVARLFDLVRPSVAVFGEKDYQQLLVIKAMVEDSSRRRADRWGDLRIEAHPTVRERDGLALSSRHVYMRPEQRESALGLCRALQAARGAGDPGSAEQRMHEVLEAHALQVEYAVVRDAETLLPVSSPVRPARALIAARLGGLRLIDNMAMKE